MQRKKKLRHGAVSVSVAVSVRSKSEGSGDVGAVAQHVSDFYHIDFVI